jgi:hypothetical protein
MRLHGAVVAMALIAVAACQEGDNADPPVAQASLFPPSPRQLATSWIGGQDQPRGHSRGPRGEVLSLPGARCCVWQPPQGSQARGTVSGQVSVTGEPTILTVTVSWMPPNFSLELTGRAAGVRRPEPCLTPGR